MSEKILWQIFADCCKIPHASGHEAALAQHLEKMAEAHRLRTRRDTAGNLRIDRPAAPGLEHAPEILLQAHMDMVPQTVQGSTFDFTKDPIETVVRDGWMYSASGTTLGADNGVGLSGAMAMLLDDELKAGPLSAVFTVEEETGLSGASALDSSMLKADYLLNLDTEDIRELCIGCAGGARLQIHIPLKRVPFPAHAQAIQIQVRNLRGGHSGMDIDKRRGNAVEFLARFLAENPEVAISKISGGTLDNVIPREAVANGAIPPEQLDTLHKKAAAFRRTLSGEFDAPENFQIEIVPTSAREDIWEMESARRIIEKLASCPNGVIALSPEWNTVKTSTNLAAAESGTDELLICTSQRSFDDAERVELTERIAAHFNLPGAVTDLGNTYPGWQPKEKSVLREKWLALAPDNAEVHVVHAGLECGIFSQKHPELEMISFGPTLENPHSPGERLNVESVGVFHRILRKLIEALANS